MKPLLLLGIFYDTNDGNTRGLIRHDRALVAAHHDRFYVALTRKRTGSQQSVHMDSCGVLCLISILI